LAADPRGARRDVPPEPAEVRIDHIGADGDGVAEHPDGSRIYVPLTVPGDLLRARPMARRGDGWAADIDTLLEPGAGRREPMCAHFGSCGGCVTQHWDEAAYLDWKTSRLAAALRRAGFEHPNMAPIIRGAPGTRRRMDLAVRRVPGGVVVGLHRARDNGIVDVTQCSVLHPSLFALIAPLRVALSGLAGIRRDASVVVNLLDNGVDLLLRGDGELITADRAKLTDFARTHRLPRISWASEGGIPEAVCVLDPPVISLSGVTVAPPPGAFLQATRDAEAAIVAAVLEGLPAKRTARARVLELFAGCGSIGFALAGLVRVLAIEGDAALVSACHAGINKAGLMGKLEIQQRDLARQPFQASELAAFAAVVLDPPHAGAAAQMPHIARAKVPSVIYVSCDPVSLGRDASVLHRAGYRLEKVTPIDQFQWSARLEAVAVFRSGR
jgi:23S rRNA (uracil1939-C5)-methyltransferase